MTGVPPSAAPYSAGMHTGVRHATDLVYSDVAARWKYSGEVLAAAKVGWAGAGAGRGGAGRAAALLDEATQPDQADLVATTFFLS